MKKFISLIALFVQKLDEAWIQCVSCKDWAHFECTDQENIDFYKYNYYIYV